MILKHSIPPLFLGTGAALTPPLNKRDRGADPRQCSGSLNTEQQFRKARLTAYRRGSSKFLNPHGDVAIGVKIELRASAEGSSILYSRSRESIVCGPRNRTL